MHRIAVLAGWSLSVALANEHASAQESANPPPIDYVRVCDVYGDGYYYVPGTETCVNADTGVTKKETEDGTIVGQTALAARVKRLEDQIEKLAKE